MNVKQLARNVGWWVHIRPLARGLSVHDPEWIVESVDQRRGTVRLSLAATGHFIDLAGDHIHSFMKDPKRRGADREFGFLILRVELTIEGEQIHIEPLPPSTPGVSNWKTQDKVINDEYVDRVGLRQRYSVLRWSNYDKVAVAETEGYRVVYEEDLSNRMQYRLIRQGQVLMGKL